MVVLKSEWVSHGKACQTVVLNRSYLISAVEGTYIVDLLDAYIQRSFDCNRKI